MNNLYNKHSLRSALSLFSLQHNIVCARKDVRRNVVTIEDTIRNLSRRADQAQSGMWMHKLTSSVKGTMSTIRMQVTLRTTLPQGLIRKYFYTM